VTLSPGTRLGPYEIVGPLGAGGMGEVYRAKDTRLDRTVAIKVLPQHLSANPEVRARFEREARTVSSLNHPHICVLHDIGHQDGVDYLVLEHLEGENLAARLAKGPLPTEMLLRTGMEIADALEKAHKSGIIHRDLKPGNVMITKSGAKLMDFGLARGMGTSGVRGDSTQSPTMSQPLTAEGTILGTFQYMAPEQLEGREADARTDIFAFGATLYEMATGKKAFAGKSQASLISAIMASQPEPISVVQPMAPAALDRVVKQCLVKDPDERWQSAGDLKRELHWIAEGGSQAAMAAPSTAVTRGQGFRRLVWTLGLALVAAGAGLAVGILRQPPTAVRPVRASILPPEGQRFDTGFIFAAPMAISPDASRLALTVREGEGSVKLWVRSLDGSFYKPLPGTEGAALPFWSPDSRWIGFFARGKLRKIEANGGPVFTLADAPDPRGGTWNEKGVILYGPAAATTLFRVSASGGKSTPATRLDSHRQENTHRFPHFLPDGRHFLYLSRRSGAGAGSEPMIQVGSLDSPEVRPLVETASNAVVASGYLLYVSQGALVARRFDPDKLRLQGDPITVAEDLRMDERFSYGVFSASRNGALVYQTGKKQPQSNMTWMDRTGKVLGTLGGPAQYYIGGCPQISHDENRVSVAIVNLENGLSDIYLANSKGGARSRLTFGPGDSFVATWSPDGNRLVYAAGLGGKKYEIRSKPASGVRSEETLVTTSTFSFPSSISPDGRSLLYDMDERGPTGRDIYLVALSGDRTPKRLIATQADEESGNFAPNGRFLAYVSDESGRDEVYVAAFPQPGGKWQVSPGGGIEPRWRADGKEIYFFDLDNRLFAAPVSMEGPDFRSGTPQPLFQTRSMGRIRYDVTRDGQRFLVNTPLPDNSLSPMTLALNWTALLEKK